MAVCSPVAPNNESETSVLLDLDVRHDEILRGLADLEERVQKVLGDWLSHRNGCPIASADRNS